MSEADDGSCAERDPKKTPPGPRSVPVIYRAIYWLLTLKPFDVINAVVGIAMFAVALAALRVAEDDREVREAVTQLGKVSSDLAKQAESASMQVQMMQKQLDAMNSSERAWIGTPRVVKYLGGDHQMQFKAYFKNSGRSPTRGLYAGARIVDSPEPNAPIWKEEAEKFCEKGRLEAQSNPEWYTMFSIAPNNETALNDDEVDGIMTVTEDVKNFKWPHLTGCVLYGTAFDRELHRTLFVAPLRPKQDYDVDEVYTIGAT